MAQKKKSSGGSSITPRTLIAALAVVVAAAAAIAIGSSGGGSTAPQDTSVFPGGVAPAQFQPVKMSGTKLAPLPEKDTDADPAVGAVAPVLNGYTFAGRPTNVSPETDGIATMLVYLAHWCPHCNREVPRLMEWYDSGKVPSKIRIVGITTASSNSQANWPPSQWMEGFKWPWEVIADTDAKDAADAYGVTGYPFIVFIDSSGKVVKRTSGEVEIVDLVKMVDAAIAA